ncbi:hypothetical protein PM082_011712 [Marasmius tenuissimus]|nr:hypothetical protein PM082_011712 [Marasmius tenuissimus]
MSMKRPSTSPGILHRTPFENSHSHPSRSSQQLVQYAGSSRPIIPRPATAHPTVSRPHPQGSGTFPRARPATSSGSHSRFPMPWETTHPPPEPVPFDEHALPTEEQLERAARCLVVTEAGVRVAFGSLWQHQKTIVIFIRHFLCPLCQDYVFSISRNYNPEVLRRDGLQLVLVSNGHHDFIKSYRKLFKLPFEMYTDPDHEVYQTLGMTLQTMEKGPRPDYIRHGNLRGIGMVLANAVKSGMPVWKNGGEISQLGGEFVLGPGITCSFSHRMRYTRSHLPIYKVVEAAKVVQPEVTMLPDILVIEKSLALNSSRTSVLEVFNKDYQDPEDYIARMSRRGFVRNPNHRATWALPSTRRSWIIEEDRETEPSEVGHEKQKGKATETEHLTVETQSLDQVDETDSEESPRTDGEPELTDGDSDTNDETATETVTETDTIRSVEDNESAPQSTVDWRRVRRGSIQWRRKRSDTVGTMATTATSRSDDVPPGFATFIKGGMSPTSSMDSRPSSGSDDSEGQVCQAFVLKLLPALDLPDATLKFEEFDWYKRNASKRSSLQLDRLPSETDGKTCGDMCSTLWM